MLSFLPQALVDHKTDRPAAEALLLLPAPDGDRESGHEEIVQRGAHTASRGEPAPQLVRGDMQEERFQLSLTPVARVKELFREREAVAEKLPQVERDAPEKEAKLEKQGSLHHGRPGCVRAGNICVDGMPL